MAERRPTSACLAVRRSLGAGHRRADRLSRRRRGRTVRSAMHVPGRSRRWNGKQASHRCSRSSLSKFITTLGSRPRR